MTSVHSQPINTISYTETEPLHKQILHPKFIHLLDDQKSPNKPQNQPKKLPFNLFLSATQYHKMLITNGKSRKNKIPETIDGLITTLEYMNDPIFQREISKRQKLKQVRKVEPKPQQRVSIKRNSRKRSFSHDSSAEPIKSLHKQNKLPNKEIKNNQTIDYERMIAEKPKKYSINYKPNHKKSKCIVQKRKSHSSFEKTHNANKSHSHEDSTFNRSQTKKNHDISHLLIKSLIQFTEQKKAEHMNRISLERTKHAKQEYLELLNKKIRSYNLQNSRRSSATKSRSKSRSLTKNQISLQYWDQIKDDVLDSLKQDNYSHLLKEQLKNYNLNVYDHKEIPQRKPRMSNQQMENRRLDRGNEAKKTIQRKSVQKKTIKNKVKQNLKSLQKERKKRISQNPKKAFKPTADLIRSAFQNLVQPSPQTKRRKQVRNVSSIFTNEGIRTVKNTRK